MVGDAQAYPAAARGRRRDAGAITTLLIGTVRVSGAGGMVAGAIGVIENMTVIRKSDDEWKAQLSPEEYRVLREAGTEAPWSGEYVSTKTVGMYCCRACGAELFRSETKFDSHCGWPSFYRPTESDAVTLREDTSHGMVRTEVRCARCDSHLGHVFEGEGYPTPTDQRYCINSVALVIQPDHEAGSEDTPGS